MEVSVAKGKPIINMEKCKGCGLCVAACPKKILRISDNTNAQGINYAECFDKAACIACRSCAIICPDMAIEIEKFD